MRHYITDYDSAFVGLVCKVRPEIHGNMQYYKVAHVTSLPQHSQSSTAQYLFLFDEAHGYEWGMHT